MEVTFSDKPVRCEDFRKSRCTNRKRAVCGATSDWVSCHEVPTLLPSPSYDHRTSTQILASYHPHERNELEFYVGYVVNVFAYLARRMSLDLASFIFQVTHIRVHSIHSLAIAWCPKRAVPTPPSLNRCAFPLQATCSHRSTATLAFTLISKKKRPNEKTAGG